MIKKSSGRVSASAAIYGGMCLYYGFTCKPGGTNRTVILYDNASAASGTEVEDFTCDANKTTDGHSHANPVLCSNGIYASLSGGSIVVYYQPYSKQFPGGAPIRHSV